LNGPSRLPPCIHQRRLLLTAAPGPTRDGARRCGSSLRKAGAGAQVATISGYGPGSRALLRDLPLQVSATNLSRISRVSRAARPVADFTARFSPRHHTAPLSARAPRAATSLWPYASLLVLHFLSPGPAYRGRLGTQISSRLRFAFGLSRLAAERSWAVTFAPFVRRRVASSSFPSRCARGAHQASDPDFAFEPFKICASRTSRSNWPRSAHQKTARLPSSRVALALLELVGGQPRPVQAAQRPRCPGQTRTPCCNSAEGR